MSEKKKLIGAAVMTGLALTGSPDASATTPDDNLQEPFGSGVEFDFASGNGSEGQVIDDLIGMADFEPVEIDLIHVDTYDTPYHLTDEVEFELAQTLYGGGGDAIVTPGRRQVPGSPQIQQPGVEMTRPGKQLQPSQPKLGKPARKKTKRQ